MLEGEETAIASQRRGKDVSATVYKNAAVEELFEEGFSVRNRDEDIRRRSTEVGGRMNPVSGAISPPGLGDSQKQKQ
jgi:hypothetical protein